MEKKEKKFFALLYFQFSDLVSGYAILYLYRAALLYRGFPHIFYSINATNGYKESIRFFFYSHLKRQVK